MIECDRHDMTWYLRDECPHCAIGLPPAEVAAAVEGEL